MGKGGHEEIPGTVIPRLVSDFEAALKRRPPSEAKLAGAVRALSPYSGALRKELGAGLEVLVRRASFDRDLYACAIRSLAEAGEKSANALLCEALGSEQVGGLAGLSAACFTKSKTIANPLARASANRHAQLAFAGEVARAARGESGGERLRAIAPKIKESHRIALCIEVFVPLTRSGRLPASVGPALAVLRDAERHLGRWLVLGDVATRAGDPAPLAEAIARSSEGPQSSRAAWSLVRWALDPSQPPPDTRPTAEIVARLSERPSADRDPAFLFRLADARAPSARPMLEGLAKSLAQGKEVSIRAAKYLVRDYGRDDVRAALVALANDEKNEEPRALAAAALWDAGDHDRALEHARALRDAKALSAQVWAALIERASAKNESDVLDESRFRRVQSGWVE